MLAILFCLGVAIERFDSAARPRRDGVLFRRAACTFPIVVFLASTTTASCPASGRGRGGLLSGA
ncbi:hypothetical protein BT67DRAFT_441232, partial [Trichocladium antarcticum]